MDWGDGMSGGQAGRPPNSIPLQLIAMHHRAKAEHLEHTGEVFFNQFLKDVWRDVIVAGHKNNPQGLMIIPGTQTVPGHHQLVSLWTLWVRRLAKIRDIPFYD